MFHPGLLNITHNYITINYKLAHHTNLVCVDKHINIITTLLSQFHTNDYNNIFWIGLSKSPYISWQFIKDNKHMPWLHWFMHSNPNITLEIAESQTLFDIDLCKMGVNKNVTMKQILARKDINWDPMSVSGNENINVNIVINTTYNWIPCILANNPSITTKDILESFDENVWIGVYFPPHFYEQLTEELLTKYKDFCIYELQSSHISQYANISLDYMKNNPDIDWDWDKVSQNKHISFNEIMANKNLFNNMEYISNNPSITWDNVKNNIHLNWDYDILSQNDNIQWEHICQDLNKNWNWKYVSKKKSITFDIVKQNPNIQWNWDNLTRNKNMTWSILRNNPEYPWNPFAFFYFYLP